MNCLRELKPETADIMSEKLTYYPPATASIRSIFGLFAILTILCRWFSIDYISKKQLGMPFA
jgi:hypothetical protein